MKTIIHAVHIHALPTAVYRALTTTDGVCGWWTTKATVDEGVGKLIRFTFHGDFHPHMQQVALEPDRQVRWECVGGHDNWLGNTFTFTLEERDGETLLMFVQHYATELSDEVYGIYNFNWGYYLNSLNSLKPWCENGVGTPFTP